MRDSSGSDKAAAGLAGVTTALKFVWDHAGTVRGARGLARVNQRDGFDCPGCAWPEPEHRSIAEFCENGAKAVAHEADTDRADAAFFARHSLAELRARSDHWLEEQGRLVEPMILREGAEHYVPVSWEEAFTTIAEELNACATPDEAVFYTSGRTSNEAAFLYQLFVRLFGTNNLPDCSNMCHESSGTGLGETIGVGKGTVGLDDFVRAGAIFVIGQNPGTNHPRMLLALQRAKAAGARIVCINPLKERGLIKFANPQSPRDLLLGGRPLADLFLQVRVGGDLALLKGIMKALLAMEEAAPGTVVDHEFIERHTEGFESMCEALAAFDWPELERESAVTRAEMEEAARIYAASPATIACWAMGITQHAHGVANVREIANLLLLGGNIGRPGAGACPVRGHSNVQGDRTMGIWEKPRPEFLDKLGETFGFQPPRRHGMDTVAALEAMLAGRVRVLFAMGGNFAAATPDSERSHQALARCRMTAHVATKLNRSHVTPGTVALLLPCLGRTERDVQAGGEQFVTVEDSMSMVHASRGNLAPASEQLLSEPAIVAGLARATLGGRGDVDWEAMVADYGRIREAIEAVIPGFERFNERVHEPGGFRLPNGARDRDFRTEVGKARFTVNVLPRRELADDQLLLMTMRSHDQFNTTVYGLDDRYRGVFGEREVVFVHPDDIAGLELADTERVDITSHFDGTVRTVRGFRLVPYDIPRGCAAAYFPEANPLVPLESFAEGSRTPAYKSVVVTLARAEEP